MKKRFLLLFALLLTLSFAPVEVRAAATDPVTVSTGNPEEDEKAKALLARLDEIKAMDKSGLTRVEKKELRKEVREIKSQLRATGNGIYLSIGAIIIIILLLILLI